MPKDQLTKTKVSADPPSILPQNSLLEKENCEFETAADIANDNFEIDPYAFNEQNEGFIHNTVSNKYSPHTKRIFFEEFLDDSRNTSKY